MQRNLLFSNRYDDELKNPWDYLIRQNSSDPKDYTIDFMKKDQTIGRVRVIFEKLKEFLSKKQLTLSSNETIFLENLIYPKADQVCKTKILLFSEISSGVANSPIAASDQRNLLFSKKSNIEFLPPIFLPPVEKFKDSKQEAQVKHEENQNYEVVPLTLFQQRKQIQMVDQEMQKVEHLIKTINDSMHKEMLAETYMIQEKEKSLLALQSDYIDKITNPESKYFIGRFDINRSDLKSEISKAEKLDSSYYSHNYSNPIDAINHLRKDVIVNYISRKLGISPPVEIELLDNSSPVKVFISGKAVSNYIAKCELTNPSVSEAIIRNVGNNK